MTPLRYFRPIALIGRARTGHPMSLLRMSAIRPQAYDGFWRVAADRFVGFDGLLSVDCCPGVARRKRTFYSSTKKRTLGTAETGQQQSLPTEIGNVCNLPVPNLGSVRFWASSVQKAHSPRRNRWQPFGTATKRRLPTFDACGHPRRFALIFRGPRVELRVPIPKIRCFPVHFHPFG